MSAAWRFEEFVEASRKADTVARLAALYKTVIEAEGYENCVLTSVRGQKLGHVAWFEFPDGYAQAYVEQRWDRIDPILARSVRATRPFFWSDAVAQTRLSPAQCDFMSECEGLKVRSGLAMPFHGPGQRLDVMSISRRAPGETDRGRARLLYAVSVQAWMRYLELADEPLFPAPERSELTLREVEVLRWCKDGKTRPEIAEILSISHKTVEFHLANIMSKLGARNQLSAVILAIRRGIIEL